MKRTLGGVAIALTFSAAVLLIAAAVNALVPVDVTVDGRTLQVPSDTTVAGLRLKGAVAARDGDLLGLAGGIVKRGGGEAAAVYRDGRRLAESSRVYAGDVLSSRAGADRVERAVESTEVLDAGEVITGSGPVVEVVSEGRDGVVAVKRGEVSRAIVASRVVQAAQPTVSLRRLPRKGERFVALTFDDGPWPGSTARILDTLRAQNVRATFFMLGGRAQKNRALARRVAREGHQIGNHTLGHAYAGRVSEKEIARQIHVGAIAIRRVTHVRPTVLRPPGGLVTSGLIAQARKERERIIMWTVDPQDWRRPGAGAIARRVIGQVRPGSVVLMHDGGGDRRQTAAALPYIIRALKAKGYTFVTVDELESIRRSGGGR